MTSRTSINRTTQKDALNLSSVEESASPVKLFVGGLTGDTSDEDLKCYFSLFGEVLDAFVVYSNRKPSGFGFVFMSSEFEVQSIFEYGFHQVKGSIIDVKPALDRDKAKRKASLERKKKIFVGGLPKNFPDAYLYEYFVQFGEIQKCYVVKDPYSGKTRGFGFVIFADSVGYNRTFEARSHIIQGTEVHIKPAVLKSLDAMEDNTEEEPQEILCSRYCHEYPRDNQKGLESNSMTPQTIFQTHSSENLPKSFQSQCQDNLQQPLNSKKVSKPKKKKGAKKEKSRQNVNLDQDNSFPNQGWSWSQRTKREDLVYSREDIKDQQIYSLSSNFSTRLDNSNLCFREYKTMPGFETSKINMNSSSPHKLPAAEFGQAADGQLLKALSASKPLSPESKEIGDKRLKLNSFGSISALSCNFAGPGPGLLDGSHSKEGANIRLNVETLHSLYNRMKGLRNLKTPSKRILENLSIIQKKIQSHSQSKENFPIKRSQLNQQGLLLFGPATENTIPYSSADSFGNINFSEANEYPMLSKRYHEGSSAVLYDSSSNLSSKNRSMKQPIGEFSTLEISQFENSSLRLKC